ncbi:MAG: methyltransferase domain-containing protein [Lachnospiraceae bacterium]|nr:methyltransferase domain-containing protein [Lachnospiraceae bacterium]
MKLHIGCGFRNLPGYKHLDIRKLDGHIDYVGSADDLSQFPDGSVEEIYACHLLEHFSRDKVNKVLKEWYRVICPGGGRSVSQFRILELWWRNIRIPMTCSLC